MCAVEERTVLLLCCLPSASLLRCRRSLFQLRPSALALMPYGVLIGHTPPEVVGHGMGNGSRWCVVVDGTCSGRAPLCTPHALPVHRL